MRKATIVMAASFCFAAGFPADAQTNKCIGPSGKPIFTDQPCEDLPGAKPAPASAKTQAKAAPKAAAVSDEDRERIRMLEAIMVDPKANNEQKTAAQLEAGYIRRGLDANLSLKDREKRELLTRQLANPDRAKREGTLRELRTLYTE
jgi:hypothetical protein